MPQYNKHIPLFTKKFVKFMIYFYEQKAKQYAVPVSYKFLANLRAIYVQENTAKTYNWI